MSNPERPAQGNEGHDKTLTIIVNAEQKTVSSRELSFEQLAAIAFPGNPQNESWLYTVTYRRGEGDKPEGTLIPGETVKLKDGMIFNVTATNRS